MAPLDANSKAGQSPPLLEKINKKRNETVVRKAACGVSVRLVL
jgi:hypothetical protein